MEFNSGPVYTTNPKRNFEEISLVTIADLHGNLPNIKPCDLLIIAGDIVEYHGIIDSTKWLNNTFNKWLDQIPCELVIGIAGNHDFIFERNPNLFNGHPKFKYLQDSFVEYKGYKIYGSPWQPEFNAWAFNLTEEQLKRKWDMIPGNTDILITHGPPYGSGDFIPSGLYHHNTVGEHVGSTTLRDIKVNPLLHIFGHIHCGFGLYGNKVNVAICDERYNMCNKPTEIHIKDNEINVKMEGYVLNKEININNKWHIYP